jgi:hypothetical protein
MIHLLTSITLQVDCFISSSALRANRFDKREKTNLGGVLSIALEHVQRSGLDYEQSSEGCTTLSPMRELHYDIKVTVEQHEQVIKAMALALADDHTFVGIAPLPPDPPKPSPEDGAGITTSGFLPYSAQALIILKHCEDQPYLLTKTTYKEEAWIKSTLDESLHPSEQANRLRVRADIIQYELPP